MSKKFEIYKGLQKPLIYKGFKGKFIYWGIGTLASGLVVGAFVIAAISKLFGFLLMIGIMGGGLFLVARKQKQGLFNKTRNPGIYVQRANLKNIYQYEKKRI
ncbi:plasmid transfer protein [Mucilaginibacter lappiensis]|uniref:Putative lipid-binding transport protein (Tim44 family) n=1 Tax=Mucilaginibacter lappiensis TaxID=354630 RepID=A0A841JRV0_9SPHI|nr:plasmid transfer protein [Mucilaginibacter lappiensis]MBB6131518.1 putative lipid-binding transport protein (Tim44 family) [Mucilaginibacter lappiensis]